MKQRELTIRRWFDTHSYDEHDERGDEAVELLIDFANAKLPGPGFHLDYDFSAREVPLYDGHTARPNHAAGGNDVLAGYADAGLHEFCHFLVASPERRNVTNFGLGGGQDNSGDLPLLGPEEAYEEELSACLLSVALAAALQLNWPLNAHYLGVLDLHHAEKLVQADGTTRPPTDLVPYVELSVWDAHPWLLPAVEAARAQKWACFAS